MKKDSPKPRRTILLEPMNPVKADLTAPMDLVVFLSISREDKRKYLIYLQNEFGIDHVEIANLFGMTREGAYKLMTDLNLPPMNNEEKGVIFKSREQRYSDFKKKEKQVCTDPRFSPPFEIASFFLGNNKPTTKPEGETSMATQKNARAYPEMASSELKDPKKVAPPEPIVARTDSETTSSELEDTNKVAPPELFKATLEVFGTLEKINDILRNLHSSEYTHEIDAVRITELIRV